MVVSGRDRRRLLLAIAIALLPLVPVAIAWACNPQAQLTPNKAVYSPGESMTVSGSFFPPGVAIKVTLGTGASATATTSAMGSFVISSLTAPNQPGNYVVTAVRADGQVQAGLPKVASFQVTDPGPRPTYPVPQPSLTGSGNFATDPTVRCGGRAVTLVGTAGNDVIEGSARRDVILGLGGNDAIKGLGADDVICGGQGRDRLAGGRGNDRLIGGAGRDRLAGGAGRDRLDGGSARDRCLGGPGRDRTTRCERRRL